MYKLQKFVCCYDTHSCKYNRFSYGPFSGTMVEVHTVNALKYRLDKHWSNQDVLFDF